jgi:hypothetical protein
MQQSDYKRRSANQAKSAPAQQQAAGIVPVDADTGNGDYLVLAFLVVSIVILAFVAARGKGIRFRSGSRTR